MWWQGLRTSKLAQTSRCWCSPRPSNEHTTMTVAVTLLLIRLVFLSRLCSLANNPRHIDNAAPHIFVLLFLFWALFRIFFYLVLVWLEAIAGNFVLSWLSRSYYIAEQSSDVLHSSWPTYFLLNKKTLFYVLALVVNRYVTYGHVYRLKKPLRSTLRK